MKKSDICLTFILTLTMGAVSCSNKNIVNYSADTAPTLKTDVTGSSPDAYIPKASAFKMNGNYSDNVAVTIDASGNLIYYPGPGDISAASRPVELGDGWFLNNQGLGPNSVFTSWTFDEYARLGTAPAPQEIKNHIIEGSEVTEFRLLPVSINDARNNLQFIRTELGIR